MQVLTVLVGSLDSRVFPNRAECKRLKLSPHAPIWRPIYMFSSRETFFDCGVSYLKILRMWDLGKTSVVWPLETALVPAFASLERASCYCVKKSSRFFFNKTNFNFCRLFGFVKSEYEAKRFSSAQFSFVFFVMVDKEGKSSLSKVTIQAVLAF